MPKVTVASEKRDFEAPVGANLRVEARKAGVDLYAGVDRYFNCRGVGACGTCKVLVKKGMDNLSPMGALEKIRFAVMAFGNIGHEDEMRLACQVNVNGDCTIETCPALNLSGENFWQKPYPNK